MLNIPTAYIYEALGHQEMLEASEARADLTRRLASKYLVGCLWGGFYRDSHGAFQTKKPVMQRPRAIELWRKCKAGDWIVVFDVTAMGWHNAFDCLHFIRTFLCIGVGFISIKQNVVIRPQSPEAQGFDQAMMLIRRAWKLLKRRKEWHGGPNRLLFRGEWDGSDLGAHEIVERLMKLGYKRRRIAGYLSDMGYRADAVTPMTVRVARLLRSLKVPTQLQNRSMMVNGMQRAEVQLIEAAANKAGLPVDLWMIETLTERAAKEMESPSLK